MSRKLNREQHGMTGTSVWVAWRNMHGRCLNQNKDSFNNYGGRGITVCSRWRRFSKFLQDMGPKPAGFTLERKNNNAGYSPSNCLWAPRSQQNLNTRRNVKIRKAGTIKTVKEWSVELGIAATTIYSRVHAGWKTKDIFRIPSPLARRAA